MAGGVVIIGGGLAGFQTASGLRDLGYAERIVVVCDELFPPYHRPPLSKAYLLEDGDDARMHMRPAQFYEGKKIELLAGRRAVSIDRMPRRVALSDGAALDYDHLVFAVGARNRLLNVPGVDLDGVSYLRTLDEAQGLKARLRSVQRAVVIGAGFIGLEFALAARELGIDVTVLDVLSRPMARVLSPAMAAVVTRQHENSGLKFAFDTQLSELHGRDGRVSGVRTADGRHFDADVVLIGIGVVPNTELASACGLEVRNGIVVNEQLLTADERVSAVGDCAVHPNPFAHDIQVRLESVQNATDQAKCVASRIVGKPQPYASVPWFWSDQGELKLQIAGITSGFDQTVMRGDPANASCTNLCFRDGRLLGIETLNRPADHMTARRLLAQRVGITPEQAADAGVELKHYLSQAA